MVVPREICNAAANAERDRVLAWLDAGGSINDVDESGYTLVHCCVYGVCEHEQDRSISDQHVALARHLIALGADVNIATHTTQSTPLHNAVINDFSGQGPKGEYLTIDMLSVLLAAKPNVNARDPITNERPLGARLRIGASVHLLHSLTLSRTARMVRMLLRAGASLDSCGPHYGEDGTAEDILERRESLESSVGLAGNEHWIEIKALVHGVRQHGSYKRYARSFHRDVLTVRGLAQRGKLSTEDSVLNFLARLGDNGVVWHVLSFWRATN